MVQLGSIKATRGCIASTLRFSKKCCLSKKFLEGPFLGLARRKIQTTVKPLIMNPPKSGQPLYSGRLTCPRLILLYRASTFRTSEKRTLLNFEQRTLISPQRTLTNTKVPPKTDSEYNAGACRPILLHHHCWIQRPSTIVALLRILLAFLVSVKQQRGPKMRPHRVQQSQITTPTGSIPNAYNGYLRIPDPQRWSRIILMKLVLLLPSWY